MFCKNCGNAINETDERCDVCQFKRGYGKNYCQYCGKKLEEGETVCSLCGNETSASVNTANTDAVVSTESAVSSVYEKKNDPFVYKKSFMRLNVFSLCAGIASFLLVICIIFLPFYKSKYEAQIEDIKDFEQLEEALENDGYLEKNFSAFDDLKIVVSELFAETDDVDNMLYKLSVLENGLFLFFEIIFSVILLCTLTKKVFDDINNIRDIDNNCILKYNEIKKSGRQETKQNFFQKQSVYVILSYAIFDIIFTKIISEFLSLGANFTIGRNMNTIAGISGFIVIIIVLLVAQIVAKSLYKKEENNIKLQIAKEE